MFGFDGEFRRRPQQSFAGASQTCDRDTIIQKAQQERRKRNELRQQNQSATVLQSYTRSFIHRQRKKREEREAFDEYLRLHRDKAADDEQMAYLLRGILFFYNSKNASDVERLIDMCQGIMRAPGKLLQHACNETIWLHRVKYLMLVCIEQLTCTNAAQAIPLRILETFTTATNVERYIEDGERVQRYLNQLLRFLVQHSFYKRLRCILEQKCPPLDTEMLHAPNHLTNALLQLLMRPLLLVPQSDAEYRRIICSSFIEHVLVPPFSDPIKKFILPCLAEQTDFPFESFMRTLHELIKQTDQAQEMAMDTEDENDVAQKQLKLQAKEKNKLVPYFNSYLLNSILILDRKQLVALASSDLLAIYVEVISKMTPKILHLPKCTTRASADHTRSSEDSSSSEEDDVDDEISDNTARDAAQLSALERDCLLECIELLNESRRVELIVLLAQEKKGDKTALYALSEICHNLMIYNRSAVFEYKLLYTLAFKPFLIRAIWFKLAEQSSQLGFSAPLTLISKGVVPKINGVECTISLLATFCMLFGRLLPTLHDAEFSEETPTLQLSQTQQQRMTHARLMPFSIAEIVQISKILREVSMGLVELAFPDTRTNLNEHYRFVLGHSQADLEKQKQQKQIWANLLNVVVFVLNQIYTRDLRLGFCPESHWTVNYLDLPLDRPADLPLTRGSRTRGIRPFQPIRDFTRADYEKGPPMSTKQIRSITILREIPFVVPFSKRVGILQGLVAADKMRVQGHLQAFLQGPSVMLTVRRTHLYEDAYDKLRPENEPDLRVKFRVQFVSSLGLDEAGIDGGGVFREFLSELIKTAFDPNRGFFMVTTDNKLYPNPNASDLDAQFEKHYYFIGRMLAKAIYENLLVELPLAEFFLTKLAGKYSDVDIHQLASLDPELYKNLLYLKDYEGDVSELNLDFTVACNSFGQMRSVDLIPNGQSITVTNQNRIEYLQLMADYKLNVQIRRQCIAFRKGLANVLPVEWLYMFSNKELQILISGAEIPIDLEDLKRHCKYGGGYNPDHPSIISFWQALESFSDVQRRQLLKFVTSCSRPPLLGFKDLDPPFFIQNAGDMERLPTASTCTNLLKLPPFKTMEQMREKLLYAIQSGAGFELS